jgi:hypothetical protein
MLWLPTTFISVMAVIARCFRNPLGGMSKFSSRERSSLRGGGPLPQLSVPWRTVCTRRPRVTSAPAAWARASAVPALDRGPPPRPSHRPP